MTDQRVKIFHNPHCSKSRESLALLEKNNAQATVIHYLETPPSANELKEILRLLNLSPRELIRKGEPVYSDNNLDSEDLDDSQLIDAMVANPILIERPIVVANGKAVIGRPPSLVLDVIKP